MHCLTLSILIASALPLAAAEPPGEVVHLKIRPHVHVRGDTATLADVLTFAAADEPLRAAIGAQPVVFHPGAVAAAVTHEQIERRLRELGLDMTRVLIGGATNCRITLHPAEPPRGFASAEAASAMARRAESPAAAASDRTLAQVLQDHVDKELAGLGGTVEVEFEQASQQFLELTTPPFGFSIRSPGRAKLGLREFRVLIRRDGRTKRTARVFARVRLHKEVLVARKPLSVGTFVQRDQVGLETRLFEHESDIGFDRIEQVVGQQVAKFIPAGQMVRRGAVKAVDLVRRSRPVTVLGAGRNVHVRLSGVALDSGGYGQIVRVRIGQTRQQRRELRGVVTGLGTVRLMENGL